MRYFASLGLLIALLAAPQAQAYTFLQRMGCPGDMGAAWPSRLLPSTWHMNQAGYSKLRTSDLVEATQRSADVWGGAWGTPCCSGFTNHFAGFTEMTGLDDSALNVVSIEEKSWPRWLGSQWGVIAVTLPRIERTECEIVEADMVFNAVTFVFRTDGAFTTQLDVDYESIAVHEFGHWIGLDHSQNKEHRSGFEPESVMFPSYRGGIDDRNLYLDDKLAACALYPAGCGECSTAADCPEGMACQGGDCVRMSCETTEDCPLGSICSDGSCWRGCRSHHECGLDQLCKAGSCTERTGCTTCRTCRQAEDCGPSGDYLCMDIDGDGTNRCTRFCMSDADCDGDSVCWDLPDSAGLGICAGPPGSAAACPDGYVCEDAPCAALGQACIRDGCGAEADTCVATSDGPICSCTCRSNSDCGANARCLPNPNNGVYSCYPLDDLERCGSTYCPAGSACFNDECLVPCGKVVCGEGEVCQSGQCVSACPTCGPGTVCDEVSKSCVPEEACVGVTCDQGETCVEGACVVVCGEEICADGQVCVNGACGSTQKGERKRSSNCSTAAEGGVAPWLVALALASLLGSRRNNHRV